MATKKEDEYSAEAYQNAISQLGAPQSATDAEGRPIYARSYEDQLADTYNKIQNREEFKYDVNADPLYQQYKDQYIQGGKLAMRDTMGKAAALTGGYASTYGQQVGQQAYDAYLQNLSDQIPNLYSKAYEKYANEGDQMLQQYNMLGNLRDTEYNMYRNELGDWENERAWNYQQEQDAWNRQQAEEQLAFNKQQQSYSNLYNMIAATGYKPTDAELKAAGMTRAAANALYAAWQKANTPVATGGGYGGGGSRSSSKTGKEKTETGTGSYTMGELAQASAAGMTTQQITQALEDRGVDTSSKYVQADIKWARGK